MNFKNSFGTFDYSMFAKPIVVKKPEPIKEPPKPIEPVKEVIKPIEPIEPVIETPVIETPVEDNKTEPIKEEIKIKKKKKKKEKVKEDLGLEEGQIIKEAIKGKQYTLDQDTKDEIKLRRYKAIYDVLKKKGYKPNKEIDESVIGGFVVNWYIGAVVSEIYDGTQAVKEVRKLFVEKLNLFTKTFKDKENFKAYFFGQVYVSESFLDFQIKNAMNGLDKARKKAIAPAQEEIKLLEYIVGTEND
jgi:hypothetical protein